MDTILFHVLHSSLKIPKIFWSVSSQDREKIKLLNIKLSDYTCNQLLPEKSHKILFPYSRIFCDVEKYKDDSKEEMSKKGMGVIYTRDCTGDIITNPNTKYKRKVIKSYYDKYHHKLDKVVSNIINKYHKCIIIDFHSFSDENVYQLFSLSNNPDICIGTDSFYTSNELMLYTVNHFKKYGYQVEMNTPYSGCIIPNRYLYKRCKKIESIMIEINKRCYLNNKDDFYKMKKCMDDYYQNIRFIF